MLASWSSCFHEDRVVVTNLRQNTLKRCLLILKALIFESRVDGGMPSLAAAPVGPATRPPASASAASIVFLSSEGGILKIGRPGSLGGSMVRESQRSSTVKFWVSQTMTDRSTTFCSSRIFPGQG